MLSLKTKKPVEIKPIYPDDYINTAGCHNLQQSAPASQCPFQFCIHHRSVGLNGSQQGIAECVQCTMLPSGFILDEDKKARYEQNIIDCQKQLIAEDQRIKANIQRDYEAAQAQLDTELNGKIDRRINKVISAEDKAEFEEFLKFQALKKQQKKKA